MLNDKYLLSHIFSFSDEENKFWASNVCKEWRFLYDSDSASYRFISSPEKLDIVFDQKNVNIGWLFYYLSYHECDNFDLYASLLRKMHTHIKKKESLDEETKFTIFHNMLAHVNAPFHWFESIFDLCAEFEIHTTLPDFMHCILEESILGINMEVITYMHHRNFFDHSFLIENSGFISTICAKYNFIEILTFLLNVTNKIDYVIVLEIASMNGNTETIQWTFFQIKSRNMASDDEIDNLKRCVLTNAIKTYDFITSYWLFESSPTLKLSLKTIMDLLNEDFGSEDFNLMFWNFFFEMAMTRFSLA